MAYLALSPVSAAVYAALNVAALTSICAGGVRDDVPQDPTYPFVWYEVRERDQRGFGTGGFPAVELRTHVYSTYPGMKEAQQVGAKVIELLRDATLTISGYTQAGRVFYDESTPLPDEELNGVKVRELVSQFRIYAVED